MSVAVCPGGSAGPCTRAFPCLAARLGRLALLCLVLGFAGWSHQAHAGMYRCRGVHGEAVFTNHPDGYTHCRAIHVELQQSISRYTGPAPAADADAGSAAAGPDTSTAGHEGVVLRGSVYRVTRPDGSVEYTNVRPKHGRGHKVTRLFTYIHTCVACVLHSSIDWSTVPLHLMAYRKAVRKAARTYGVNPAFLRAVIHAESAFNPHALSAKGAQGLMQLMPATASSMGVADAFNAVQNIRGGARYLARLLKDFHGNHRLAAAAYNAGPQAVRKYGGVPPYAETRVYVKRVGTLYRRYTKALGGPKLADMGQPG